MYITPEVAEELHKKFGIVVDNEENLIDHPLWKQLNDILGDIKKRLHDKNKSADYDRAMKGL